MNVKLEAALAYSRMHWRIFPCHSIIDGVCSCGKGNAAKVRVAATGELCESPGKHPLTKHGFKDATDDPNQIRKWWTRWPDANLALATGDGIVAIDIDGPEGMAAFKAFVEAHGRVPSTLTSQTGRGYHLLFATQDGTPTVRSGARGKVHIRGEGGYIILPPSSHHSGRNYQWIKQVPIAFLPDNLRQWSQGYEISKKSTKNDVSSMLGEVPSHLFQEKGPKTNELQFEIKTEYSAQEHGRLVSALQSIPVESCSYDVFLHIGMALKDLDWEKSDGSNIGFELWDAWCSQSKRYNPAGLERKWRSFQRSGIAIGTIYHLAKEHGWTGLASPLGGFSGKGLNGHASGPQTLPAAFLGAPIHFPDVTDNGKIRSTMTNAKVAINGLGIGCRYDLFHNRYLLAGEIISQWCSGEISDPVVLMVRDRIRARWGFDPGTQCVRDAAEALCLGSSFDPVLDYLESLQWDGVPRLDQWLSTYMGADDSELTRTISRLSLIAAVRRAQDPGTKFDHIIVFEGPQGAGKSEAIRILAGPENFSDQKILGVDDRKQQELTEGVWLYEIAELTGLRKAEREHVKAFVSRQVDRARPAYGRYTVHQPRRTVFFGSTNQNIYLEDDTGNRRFWPVKIGKIDLNSLRRDRDQLWAEAAHREATGEAHTLPERLWKDASEAQEGRTIHDEWQHHIAEFIAIKQLSEVSVSQVLIDNQFLGMRAADIGQREQNRASVILRGLGFTRFQKRLEDGRRVWLYRKH